MNSTVSNTSTTWLDPAGICLSFLCAVYCLFAPFLMTILPLTSLGFLADKQTEGRFVIAVLAVAGASLTWGFHVHRQQRLLLSLGVAAAMMRLGRFTLTNSPYEIALVTAGAALLVVSHTLNFHLCRTCTVCAEGVWQ